MEGNCTTACKHFNSHLGKIKSGKFELNISCNKSPDVCRNFWAENGKKKSEEVKDIFLPCYEPTESYKSLCEMNDLASELLDLLKNKK